MAATIRAILGCMLTGLFLGFAISNSGVYVVHSEWLRTTGIGAAGMFEFTCPGILVPVIVYTFRRQPIGCNGYIPGVVAAIVNIAWLFCIYPSITTWNPLAASLGPRVGSLAMIALSNLIAAALSVAALTGLDVYYRRKMCALDYRVARGL